MGKINDGGSRISYGDGMAVREPTTGKGRYDLVSPFAIDRWAKWMELGAQKYAPNNWTLGGIPYSRFADSALRHLSKFIMGMDDEDHLSAVLFNIGAIIHFQETGHNELDDMPHFIGRKDGADN